MRSTVSVVIPCYRYGRYLRDCVRSAVDEQQDVDVQVLIIDDCSPDDSWTIAEGIAAEYPNVAARRHESNVGHIATYNEGIDWAAGDYFVLLSADDRLTPNALRRATQFMEAETAIGLVYGRYVEFNDDVPLPAARIGGGRRKVYDGRWWIERRCKDATSCIASPEVVVRTSVQKRVGHYDPTLPHSGDLEMWLRFAAVSDIGYIADVDQAYYRRHAANMSLSYYDASTDDLRQRASAFAQFASRFPGHPCSSPAWQGRVRSKLAREALTRAARSIDVAPDPQPQVTALESLAAELDPEARRSIQRTGLDLRKRLGSRVMKRAKWLMPRPYVGRLRAAFWWYSWERRGV
jgi:glycosyltransferase involved in cell wall biosynthesis